LTFIFSHKQFQIYTPAWLKEFQQATAQNTVEVRSGIDTLSETGILEYIGKSNNVRIEASSVRRVLIQNIAEAERRSQFD
jgi:hypothetical protein